MRKLLFCPFWSLKTFYGDQLNEFKLLKGNYLLVIGLKTVTFEVLRYTSERTWRIEVSHCQPDRKVTLADQTVM